MQMPVSKLTARRLTKLIRFMRKLPKSAEKHFDMSVLFSHDGEHGHAGIERGAPLPAKVLTYCGTTACAAGWACMIPAFRKAGLRLIDTGGKGDVQFRGDSIDAVDRFFRLNYRQADALFGGGNRDKTQKAWAKRAAKLLKQWKKKARAR